MIHTIEIPQATPLLNEIKRLDRSHWSLVKKLKADWLMLIRQAALHVPKATGPRRMILIRYSAQVPDFDNLVGGGKEVIDCLRPAKVETGIHKTGKKAGQRWVRSRLGLGLILEDDPVNFPNPSYLAALCKRGAGHTTITLEDLDARE